MSGYLFCEYRRPKEKTVFLVAQMNQTICHVIVLKNAFYTFRVKTVLKNNALVEFAFFKKGYGVRFLDEKDIYSLFCFFFCAF